MTKKSFFQTGVVAQFSSLWAFLFFIFVQTGCNSGNNSDGVRDWITMEVKFKPNTSIEVQDKTIAAIEKLLMDSVAVRKTGKSTNYSPCINVAKNISGDPLQVSISLGRKGCGLQGTLRDTIPPPPCTCKNNCGVCELMSKWIAPNDTTANNPYRNIATITYPGQEK